MAFDTGINWGGRNMKLWIALCAMVMATPLWAADPLEGMWQTQVDDGAFAYVEITPCGAALCGVMKRSFNADGEYQSDNLGRTLVIDMVPSGGDRYKGQVWRPSNDKVYIGRIVLNGNSLKMKGCVAGGLLCASQTWSRLQ